MTDISKDELIKNLDSLHERLFKMIPKSIDDGNLNNVELEISGMMYDVQYFKGLIQITYPLETMGRALLVNPANVGRIRHVELFVQRTDFNMRKSFITIMQFNLETLLGIIAKEHEIIFSKNTPILKRYNTIMNFFTITTNNYQPLLKTYHYVRNTLHVGTKIKDDFGPYIYKGCKFETKKGQGYIKFADWRHFTWFTSEVLEIYEKILASNKYTLL
jgi:hypothetical protein